MVWLLSHTIWKKPQIQNLRSTLPFRQHWSHRILVSKEFKRKHPSQIQDLRPTLQFHQNWSRPILVSKEFYRKHSPEFWSVSDLTACTEKDCTSCLARHARDLIKLDEPSWWRSGEAGLRTRRRRKKRHLCSSLDQHGALCDVVIRKGAGIIQIQDCAGACLRQGTTPLHSCLVHGMLSQKFASFSRQLQGRPRSEPRCLGSASNSTGGKSPPERPCQCQWSAGPVGF